MEKINFLSETFKEKAFSNKIKFINHLKNIKSVYIFKKIIGNIPFNKALNIIRYNKHIQKKLNVNINDFIKESVIEIELIPFKKKYGEFINIVNKEQICFYHIYFNNNQDEIQRTNITEKDEVNKIKIIINYQVTSFYQSFAYCECIESINFINFQRKNITNTSFMFYKCSSLKEINFYNFNTDNVTDMCYMFNECGLLNKLELSKFNTEKVFDMQYMFGGCNKLKEINLSNFNTENVKNMNRMFKDCYSINYLPINNFNTGKAEEMKEMFYNCKSLKNIDLSNFNTSKVQNMTSMFVGCPNEIIAKIKNSYKNFTDDAFTLPKMDYDEEIIGCVPPPFDFDDDM